MYEGTSENILQMVRDTLTLRNKDRPLVAQLITYLNMNYQVIPEMVGSAKRGESNYNDIDLLVHAEPDKLELILADLRNPTHLPLTHLFWKVFHFVF